MTAPSASPTAAPASSRPEHEVERQEAAVLVAQGVADGVGVVREGRLVPDEAGRIRRCDPELEPDDEEDESDGRAHPAAWRATRPFAGLKPPHRSADTARAAS